MAADAHQVGAVDGRRGELRGFDIVRDEDPCLEAGARGLRRDGVDDLGDVGVGAALDEGEVDLDLATIECPLHGSTFDLQTGAPKTLPAIQPVATYPVTVAGGDVLIEV